MNTFILGGRLTKTPQQKTQNGVVRTSFTIACRQNYKGKDGEYGTDFICIQAYRQRAEYIAKHLKQGDFIEVMGTIQSRVIENENSKKIDYYFKCDEISLAAHPQQRDEPVSENDYDFDFCEEAD